MRGQGTIRDLSPTVSELINRRLHAIVHSTCEAMGCKAEVRPSRHARQCGLCEGTHRGLDRAGPGCARQIDISDCYPVLVNHETETEHVRRAAARVVGPENVRGCASGVSQHDRAGRSSLAAGWLDGGLGGATEGR